MNEWRISYQPVDNTEQNNQNCPAFTSRQHNPSASVSTRINGSVVSREHLFHPLMDWTGINERPRNNSSVESITVSCGETNGPWPSTTHRADIKNVATCVDLYCTELVQYKSKTTYLYGTRPLSTALMRQLTWSPNFSHRCPYLAP